MPSRSILFIFPDLELESIIDPQLKTEFFCEVVGPGRLPEQLQSLQNLAILVVAGYSLQDVYHQIPGLEPLLATLNTRTPCLFLLHATDPSLSLVPLKGEQRFFYLRGPLSTRALRAAIGQILSARMPRQRVELSPELGISAWFRLTDEPDAPLICKELREISPRGFSFLWGLDDPYLYPGDLLHHLELRAHDRPFLYATARVRNVSPVRHQRGIVSLRMGVEFLGQPQENHPTTDSRNNAFLTDPLVIRTVLSDAVERRNEVTVLGEGHNWEVQGVMAGMDESNKRLIIKLPTPLNFSDIETNDIVTCQFVRDNAQLQCFSVLMEIRDGGSTLELRFPRRLDRLWARSTLRYTFEGSQAPFVELYSPISPQTALRRAVQNLSPNGLSFWAESDHDLLFRQMRLNRLELVLPNGPRLQLAAEVRYIGPRETARTADDREIIRSACGLRFTDLSSADHLQLVNYLIQKNYPNVGDATLEDEEALWKFLEVGEFYTASKREECLGRPEEVRDTQRKMIQAPLALSRKLIFKDNGRLYGSVSLQQIFSHTWLVHHLCAVPHPHEFVPKSLLLFLGEYISKTPEIRYIKMMWRPNNTWSNKMFGRLVHRLHDGEQSVVKTYHYLHWQENSLPPLRPEDREWSVRLIQKDEAVELETYFLSQEEYFLMRSEDLLRDRLTLSGLNTQYQDLQLFRERKVLICMERGRLMGFALLEHSSPGLNLSNLLNACQVYTAVNDPMRAASLKRALLVKVIEAYAMLGQKRVVVLTEDRDLTAYHEVGFEKVKEYTAWTFEHSIANIYNLYSYYIFRLYERLEARRRARQNYYGT
ncbi:MAG: hypothetical protein ACKO6N_21565 [Myxococcota bacterium]